MTDARGESAFAEAAALVAAGNLPGAEARLREALAIQPGHVNAALTLANLLIHREAPAEAEPVLREHLARAPTVDGLLLLARVTEISGRLLESERHLLEALRHVPDHPPVVYAVADFYLRNKARREATKHLKRYVALMPTDSAAAIKYAQAIWPEAPLAAAEFLEASLRGFAEDDHQALRLLEKLAVLKEWNARKARGLPLYHGTRADDLLFKFSTKAVEDFAAVAHSPLRLM